jgi:predicted RecB family nuclease
LYFGYADVLRKVEGDSALGGWHYEVHDTKLTTETKGGTILQLCVYTDLLGALQGRRPDRFVVVTPAESQVYRFEDFAAYYRLAMATYSAYVASPADIYPNLTEHCEVCRWWERCNARRRRDDHLSFVAGLGRTQQVELESHAITTLAALSEMPVPLEFKPRRGARETYEKLREQARLQRQAREESKPVYELLPVDETFGFCRLPEPSPGDLFLDLEGDPYVRPAGREYLFGLGHVDAGGQFVYRAWWAMTDEEERGAFDELMGLMLGAVAADPGVHIYHYAPYEPTAMKRLMGRYGIRETDVDALLRGGRFVDLYAVVRESLRAGVESYSIKKMEPLYHFTRDVELVRAGDQRRIVEVALELGDQAAVTAEIRGTVEGYNRDDVRSTMELRKWLEQQRAALVAGGADVPRFVSADGEASEEIKARQRKIEELRARILARAAAAAPGGDSDALSLFAYLVDWHYREDKVAWWEYFRLRGMTDEELLDEGNAVAGLEFLEKVRDVVSARTGRKTGSGVLRYRYPPQEMEIRAGAELHQRDQSRFGEVVAVDRGARTMDVRRGKSAQGSHPLSAFVHEHVSPDVPAASLFRMGEHILARGLGRNAEYAAGLSVLLRESPRVSGVPFESIHLSTGESVPSLAARIAVALSRTALPIQGPPGAGKTYTGGRMICELVKQGKRVGVTATGHKVIRGLLDRVAEEAGKQHLTVRIGHKPKAADDAGGDVVEFGDNGSALAALSDGSIEVLGGTAWMWARPEFASSVDVLFVDEAGQMSLANVLAVSQAADSLVLLGDPQQLEQPQKGSHPPGVGVSALQHVLGEHETMPPDRGIFLPETWRLAPAICDFTSRTFYEGKLHPKPGLETQRIVGSPRFSGAGLRVVECPHAGCRNASDDEVDVVETIVTELLSPGVEWRGEHDLGGQLTARDILVVAPYNAHVGRLQERIAVRGVSVGTVDKFQGQEAPVVIYSMATSSPADAPRGMEFLYSLNRLNVATSRARCLCILVASPRLFEPECRTPRQMRLANGLCWYREMSHDPGSPR